MASAEGNIVSQLQKHTECSICMTTFTDPRILPCVHSFCLKCLENTAANTYKIPGDRMPCPYCRTMFTIPPNGFTEFMINFDLNSLITMTNDALFKSTVANVCDRHKTKPLEIFCLECEQPVCFSCLIDNHQGHKASDIADVKERFSLELADYMKRISSYREKGLSLMKEQDEKKNRYLKEIEDKKSAILKRSKELVDRIERNTRSLLKELSSLKEQHLAEMEKEREELETQCTIMEDYQTVYEAPDAKASLVDICDAKKQMHFAVEKLDDWLKWSKVSSFEVLLQLHDKIEIDLESEVNNVVGRIKETAKNHSEVIALREKKVLVVGSYDEYLTNEVYEVNLHRPNEISKLLPVPIKMHVKAVPVSFHDKLVLIGGMGEDCTEIWKFERISGWKKCANFDEERSEHCVQVVDTLIYIWGGWNKSYSGIVSSVEAYDLQTDKCSIVGQLVYPVVNSASVAHNGLIYIFGGSVSRSRDDKRICGEIDCVQVFDTGDNTCSLSSKPMPSPQDYLRALPWNNSVILLNDKTCFVFDFETEIWQERKQFKTDVVCFGLVHDDEKVYVFGGSASREDYYDKTDEVKCVRLDDIVAGKNVEWQFHGCLPEGFEIHEGT